MLNQRSNIPAAPAYKVYISQLIGYSKAGGSYQNFLDRELLAANKEVTEPRVFTSKVLRSPL